MSSPHKPNLSFIYWFAYYNEQSPSVRYRALYPLEHLRKYHHVNSALIFPGYRPDKIFKFLRFYLSALFFRKKNSLIVVQRIHSNFIYANLLKILIKLRKSNTAYDLDDADWLEHPAATIYYFVRNSSCVVAGSHELAKNLAKQNPTIFLNTSPTPDLNISKKGKNEVLTVGWIGCFGGGHKQSLIDLFFPSLKNLPIKIKLVLLGVTKHEDKKFIEHYFAQDTHIELDISLTINWLDEKALQQKIVQFDVGIATLLDDELHRSKSAFKLKQYLTNGVPVLSSNLPENNYFLEDGKNGFLCQNAADFRNRLLEINQLSHENYVRLSQQARASADAFNLNAYSQRLLELAQN